MSVDFYQSYRNNIQLKLVTGLFGLSTLVLGVGVLVKNTPSTMFGLFGVASGSALLKNLSKENAYISEDVADVVTSARSQNLFTQLTAVESENYPVFDWQWLITEADRFPHILVLGGTGDGKSTLVEAIAPTLSNRVLVVAPHWQSGDFKGCNEVYGKNRNIGNTALPYKMKPLPGISQNEVKLVPFNKLKSDTPVLQVLQALYVEMIRRYELVNDSGVLDDNGIYRYHQEGSEKISVILDEFLAYARLPGVPFIFKGLVREARKVGISLLILVQGQQVQSLGIEGESDLRSSLVYVRCGDFAIKYADEIKGVSLSEVAYRRLCGDEYPTMVEDWYAIRPKPNQITLKTETPTKVLKPVELEVLKEVEVDEDLEYYNLIIFHKELGMQRSAIIKNALKFKGVNYPKGVEIYERVCQKYDIV